MPKNKLGRSPDITRQSGPNTWTIATLRIPGRMLPARPTFPYQVNDLPPEIAQHVIMSAGGCWLWQGNVDRDGYGRYRGEGAHRVVYRELTGPIPDGNQLDHLCHTRDTSCPGGKTDPHRRCVYPGDLEPVTGLQNSLRGRSFAAVNAAKDKCDHGHPFDLINTYWRPNGHRDCRTCVRRRAACPECGSERAASIQVKNGRAVVNVHCECDRPVVDQAIAQRWLCYTIAGKRSRKSAPDLGQLQALLLDKSVPGNALRIGCLLALGKNMQQIIGELGIPRSTFYDAVRILGQHRRSASVRILGQDARANSPNSRTTPQAKRLHNAA